MAIQDNINQAGASILGAVVATQHIKDQKEQAAVSAQGHLTSAREHENLKEQQYQAANQELNEAETKMPMHQMENDYEQNRSDVWLKEMEKDDLNANMSAKHPRNAKGQFESRDSAIDRFQKANDELEALKKSQQELTNKIDARKAQKKLVENRAREVAEAKIETDLAQRVFNKNKSWLGGI